MGGLGPGALGFLGSPYENELLLKGAPLASQTTGAPNHQLIISWQKGGGKKLPWSCEKDSQAHHDGNLRLSATPNPGNKGNHESPYEGIMVVDNPLTGPYFLGRFGWHWGGWYP